MKHLAPGVGQTGDDTCLTESSCAKRYGAESIQKGFVSKLKIARKKTGKERNGTPSAWLVDSYLTFVSEEQNQVGVQVNQGAPMLEHTLIGLLRDMRSRAQAAS